MAECLRFNIRPRFRKGPPISARRSTTPDARHHRLDRHHIAKHVQNSSRHHIGILAAFSKSSAKAVLDLPSRRVIPPSAQCSAGHSPEQKSRTLCPSGRYAGCKALQIRFRSATGRIPAPDKSYGKIIGSHLRHDNDTGCNHHNISNPMVGETLNAPSPPRPAADQHRCSPGICFTRSLPGSEARDLIRTPSRRCALRIAADFSAVPSLMTTVKPRSPPNLNLLTALASGPSDLISRSALLLRSKKEISRLDRRPPVGHWTLRFVSQLVRRLSPNAPRCPTKLGIPSIVEIPTWHRDRGKVLADRAPHRLPHPPMASALEGKSAPDS